MYTVTLTAHNANGSNTVQVPGYIIVITPPPVAEFSANVTDGVTPLCVQFTDSSGNDPTDWEWDFGDGTSNSTSQNPVHVYESAGTYTVTLTASNAGGSGSLRKTDYVTVTDGTITYDLNFYQGWNIISLPITPLSDSISSIFSPEQQANIDVIWDFNYGNWQFWTTEPGYTNQFSSMSTDKGYYFYCYESMTVQITGTPASGPISDGPIIAGLEPDRIPESDKQHYRLALRIG